jgi:UDP-N-acetylglucosamine diphosphorylase/glucosamine-1-phosphate N-acetyltransferase
MKINLDDNKLHLRFAPLTLTRPLGNLRMGILCNNERWKMYIPEAEIGFTTEKYLQEKFMQLTDAIQVNASVIPNEDIAAAVFNLEDNSTLFFDKQWIAKRGTAKNKLQFKGETPIILKERWDLFLLNEAVLNQDFELLTNGRKSQKISKTNTLIGDSKLIFVEEGAMIDGAILNTTTGPIYIGQNTEIMEGSLIRGPFALCDNSTLKLGTKVYGASTIGPHCKIGGEISNVIFQSYSNKGHDGFIGNSVIGEWCNLGAGTNSSNLKNNYGKISSYSYEKLAEVETNQQFMGLFMGDHSKSAINTLFNTASVVGVSVTVFGADFPPKFIPSFSWGFSKPFVEFKFDKAIEAANNMMERRSEKLSAEEENILVHLKDVYGLK